MTTDNRTNEPTEAQVEAAAKFWADYEWVSWEVVPDHIKVMYRAQARAVLEVAQGAAPQKHPTIDEIGKDIARGIRDSLSGAAPQAESDERIQAWERLIQHPVWRSCFEEERPLIDSMMERIDNLAELEMTVNELAPAPVLSSSGVDEDALAELIESIIRENWEMFDDRRHQAQVIARAVAEWLTGKEKNDEDE